MLKELEMFRKHFKDYKQEYTIIGGVAAFLNLDRLGIAFRSTRDIDLVVHIRANNKLDKEFEEKLMEFIQQGKYQVGEKKGNPTYYRFHNPQVSGYPKEIELFARKQLEGLDEDEIDIIYIEPESEQDHFSAILLNEDYYKLLKSNDYIVEDISILSVPQLILFKAKAWLDLRARKEDSKKIDKHRKDIIRLTAVLEEYTDELTSLEISESIRKDFNAFLKEVETENKDISDLSKTYPSIDKLCHFLKETFNSHNVKHR